jgi:hypothetical protein
MARVFTTPFTFNDRTYHAFVITKVKDDKMDFSIHLQDIDLHELIPGGRFDYSLEEGCRQTELLENRLAKMIIERVTQSIYEHLQRVQPLIHNQ